MKKLLPKLALVLIAGLILMAIAGGIMFKPAVRKAIEDGSTAALGVSTSLADFSAGLGFGKSDVGIEGFSAANPEGFGEDKLLNVGELSVEVATMSLLSDTIEVPNIRLSGLELRLIQDGKRSNFGEMLKHLRSLSESTSADAPAADSQGSSAGKEIAFGLVDIGAIAAHFDLRGIPGIEDQWDFELPAFQLDFTEEGSDSPRNVAEFSSRLMDELLGRAVTSAQGFLPEGARELLDLDLSADGLDAALEDAKGQASEAADSITDQAKKKIDKGLGGLLDRKD